MKRRRTAHGGDAGPVLPLEADVCLPSDADGDELATWGPAPPEQSRPFSQAKLLIIAILDTAIRDAQYGGARTQSIADRADARAWVRGIPSERPWPMTFEAICEHLDIASDRLRAKILGGERPNLRLVIGRKRATHTGRHARCALG